MTLENDIKLQSGFGFMEDIKPDNILLRDRYVEPPFSVLDTKQGTWQNRKKAWINLGIKSEIGRGDENSKMGNAAINSLFKRDDDAGDTQSQVGISIFDPVLTELMYRWFAPPHSNILDPFAGGSVRGIVAQHLGYHYDGIELRQEQVDSNRENAMDLLKIDNQPNWYVGDSDKILDQKWNIDFDFIFSCPPYVDLEVYSDLPDDLSNMDYKNFMVKYRSIIKKSLALLKQDCYACFVVGEVRDKNGYFYNFVGDTIKAFLDCGAKFYNDAVLLNMVGSAPIRASAQFDKGQKLVKLHQNVLIFKKVF